MRKTALVSGLNQQFRLTPNNRDLECCVITAVCQEAERTRGMRTHTHTHSHTHTHTHTHTQSCVHNNLKFPQTGVLLGTTNQLCPKHLKNRKLIINRNCFLQFPSSLLRKSFGEGGPPLIKMHCLSLLTTSTYWHYSELTLQKKKKKRKKERDQINKQWGEMLFSQGFK